MKGMSKRLSTAERNRIIYDYINGIMDEQYEVKRTRTNKYQVRKRKSPFNEQGSRNCKLLPPEPVQPLVEPDQEAEEEHEEEPALNLNRISNEQLLMKLSSLLDLKSKEADKEEYIDTAPAPTPQETQQQVTYAPQCAVQSRCYGGPEGPRPRCGHRKRLSLI